MPLNSSRTLPATHRGGRLRRSNDNSRRKVQNVRGDSSAPLRSGVWWTCGSDVLDWIGERVSPGREFFESGDEIPFAQQAVVTLRPAHHPSKRAALAEPSLRDFLSRFVAGDEYATFLSGVLEQYLGFGALR